MDGDLGEPVIYVDLQGEEHEGIIQNETMEGNATIVFFKDDDFSRSNARIGFNIPCEDGSVKDRQVYRLMDDPEESRLASEISI